MPLPWPSRTASLLIRAVVTIIIPNASFRKTIFMQRTLAVSSTRLFVIARTANLQQHPSIWTVVSSTHRAFSESSEADNDNYDIKNRIRPDPFARRPNQKCDPYGQGGKPLSASEAKRLLTTVHPDWTLGGENQNQKSEASTEDENKTDEDAILPTQLTRTFTHPDFLSGAAFLNHVAAVAQMNDHFPSLHLERTLDSRQKQWRVLSTVTCQTFVLQGLSHHDFFVATLIDVEMDRPEIRPLLLRE